MIGIIGAMPAEVEALRRALEAPATQTVSGICFVSGSLCGQPAVVAQCGIGKVNAALCTEAMIVTFHPTLILNTGVAGSLCDKAGLLDVVVADTVVQHDFDTTAFGDPLGLLPGIGKVHLPADPAVAARLANRAESLGFHAVCGTVASGDRFLDRPEHKLALHRDFDAVACEMEGAAIGQVCYLNQVPFGILRVISDSSDGDGAMEYETFMEQAAARSCRIVMAFCREDDHAQQ